MKVEKYYESPSVEMTTVVAEEGFANSLQGVKATYKSYESEEEWD